MIPRRPTRQVFVGAVPLGGGAPVVLQTMTAGYTHDVDACIAGMRNQAQTEAGARAASWIGTAWRIVVRKGPEFV